MRYGRILLPVLIMLFAAGGCGFGGPESTAKSFWKAMIDGDQDRARKLATRQSAGTLELEPAERGEERSVKFGKAVETDGQVSVPTTLVTRSSGKEEAIELNTILVREDGDWKVDWHQTMGSMLGGIMGEMMKGMGDAMEEMGREMERSFKEMGKAFEEAMKEPANQ
jgi:hypothetical protein